jgi:ATP-dependent DNA helicase DinG
VVAILDSRMVSARYASFLQRSLPPFWPTTDRELVLAALKRLDEVAPPPMPVTDPALRGLVGALEGAAVGGDALEPGVDHRPVAGPPPVPPSPRTAVTVGHAWTPTQDEALRDAAEAGIDMEDVVDQLELPVDAIQARLAQLGLTLADSNDVDDLSMKLVAGSGTGPARSGTGAQDDADVEEPSLFPDPGRPATPAKRL